MSKNKLIKKLNWYRLNRNNHAVGVSNDFNVAWDIAMDRSEHQKRCDARIRELEQQIAKM